jgi:hypothetical protein
MCAAQCVDREGADLTLHAGTIGTVIDTFAGNAYLVEFGSRGVNDCDWLGV